MVKYEVEEYELQNVHGFAGYIESRNVNALLSNGKLYANIEGMKSTSLVAIVYFIFLFGTFGMLIASSMYMSKIKKVNDSTDGFYLRQINERKGVM